jgi:tRNA(fMet)-specific endonuclease VapC
VEVRILIDTNRYKDFCLGIPEVVGRFREAERICLPFVTLAELRAGFLCGTEKGRNERILGLFLNRSRVECVWADENTTHHYARLFLQLRRQGTPIPTNDIWIAALAVQHDLQLYSRDAHFDSLPQLPRLQ